MSFKAVEKTIEKKDGVSKGAAGAILAKSTRDASPAAKKKNPKLKKVKPAKDSSSSQAQGIMSSMLNSNC
jgi:hypothetical protein